MDNSYAKIDDIVKVVSTIHDVDENRYFIEIEYLDVEAQRERTILPRGAIRPNGKALEKLLDAGADLPSRPGVGAELLRVLSASSGPVRRVTRRTGWQGSSFVLPDMTIGPDADALGFQPQNEVQNEVHTAGGLEEWRDQLTVPCQASTYLTFGMASGFAGPLLKLLKQDEGASFYLSGESSTGKTLSELGGQSVIGCADRKELLTHDVTPRALEEAAAARNDLTLVIDELARKSEFEAAIRKHIRELAHKLAGGGGRRRSNKATQDTSLENLHWRLFSLWSGEYPLDSRFLGEARKRGEIVRLAEIRVPNALSGGIFDRMTGIEFSTAELARKVEDAVQANFGHPIRTFLNHLTTDLDTYTKRARALVDEFVRKVGGQSDAWTHRFATKFAVVYAGGHIAAEMGIAPWSSKHAFTCIAHIYRNAREVVATPEEALTDLLHRLAKNATSKTRFPGLKKGVSLPKHAKAKAWGLRREVAGTPANLAILSEKFDKLVRPREHSAQVRKLLADGGYTLPGKEGRLVTQLQVKGFGSSEKPYFIRVRLDRLPAIK
jgi:uncharacterized protein DUF927